MNTFKRKISVKTSCKNELLDLTQHIERFVQESGVGEGVCFVFCPHTTAGLTINENADPDVKKDVLKGLEKMVPSLNYSHMEGNSPAHIKASLMGFSLQVLIQDSSLILGIWQGIYFCEFDGPRKRSVHVQIMQ